MAIFKISATVTVSCWTEVEASTEEEAKHIAARRTLAESHIDGSYPVDECWHFDTDGEPTNIRIGE